MVDDKELLDVENAIDVERDTKWTWYEVVIGIVVVVCLLSAVVILLSTLVRADEFRARINLTVSSGFVRVDGPGILYTFPTNNDSFYTFDVVHTYVTRNVTYQVFDYQNLSVMNCSTLSSLLVCPSNVTVAPGPLFEKFDNTTGEIKTFVSDYLYAKLIPDKDAFEVLRNNVSNIENKMKDLTYELNLSRNDLETANFKYDTCLSEKKTAYYLFFAMFGMCLIIALFLTGVINVFKPKGGIPSGK